MSTAVPKSPTPQTRRQPLGRRSFGRCPLGRVATLVLTVVVAAGVATGAVAAIPNSNTKVISACYADGATKTLRVIDAQGGETCPTGTTPIAWNSTGVIFRGAYSPTTAYRVNDIVTAGGQTYIARLANTGVPVSNATNWALMAAKGATGPRGPKGATGATTPGEFVDLSTFSSSTLETWETFSSTLYTVPAGADVVARFSAESYCEQVAWCSVRILVDGVEMAGGSGSSFAFDDGDPSSRYEAHSMDRYAENLAAGSHVFDVQTYLFPSGATSPFFRVDDMTLVLQTID